MSDLKAIRGAMKVGEKIRERRDMEQAILNLRTMLPADDLTTISEAVQEATARGVDAETIAEAIRDTIPEGYRR